MRMIKKNKNDKKIHIKKITKNFPITFLFPISIEDIVGLPRKI